MSDVIASISYDRSRARKQIRTTLIVGSISAVVTIAFIAGAVAGGGALLIFFAVIFGISAVIFLGVAKLVDLTSKITKGAVTTAGVIPPAFPTPIPWEMIRGITVVRYNNSVKASNSVASAATANALAAGGVNDGERTINIVTATSEEVRNLLPKSHHYLVNDRLPGENGDPGVSILLGQAMSAEVFQEFVVALDGEANRHGVTVRYA